MKKILIAVVLAAAAAPVAAQVGISIGVNQPGFYGQINIGDVAQPPQVVYAQPVLVEPPPPAAVVVPVQPMYLHVPPGHIQQWRRYCHDYNACNRPVYFVQDDWFNREYWPHHAEHAAYYGDYPHRDDHWHDDHHDHYDDHGDHGHGHDDHDHDHDHDH